jgi:hypothetical protein
MRSPRPPCARGLQQSTAAAGGAAAVLRLSLAWCGASWVYLDSLQSPHQVPNVWPVVAAPRARRQQAMVENSRGWVPREEFEARLQQALDNPLPL